jgi:hypothetical protein
MRLSITLERSNKHLTNASSKDLNLPTLADLSPRGLSLFVHPHEKVKLLPRGTTEQLERAITDATDRMPPLNFVAVLQPWRSGNVSRMMGAPLNKGFVEFAYRATWRGARTPGTPSYIF